MSLKLSTNSGQAAGAMLPLWSPCVPRNLASQGAPFFFHRVMDANASVGRILLSAGNAVSVIPRMGLDFSGDIVHEMSLPEWVAIDVTLLPPDGEVMTITAVQIVERCEEDVHSVKRSVYMGRTNTGKTWSEFRGAMSRFALEETWNRLVGIIRPSWGIQKDGRLFLGECGCHVGAVSSRTPLPDEFDSLDLGRLEHILEREGANPQLIGKEKTLARISMFTATENVANALHSFLNEQERKRGGYLIPA